MSCEACEDMRRANQGLMDRQGRDAAEFKLLRQNLEYVNERHRVKMESADAEIERLRGVNNKLEIVLNRGIGFLEGMARDAKPWSPERSERLQDYAEYFESCLPKETP